jgi:SAM-dependent methyltransferase
MPSLPPIHICVQQPAGYVHSLGFLDQARYFRYQLRRLGAEVGIAKNRLRHDALNIVFGAHLGFPIEQRERFACVFVNLEQLGEGGAALPPAYLELLAGAPVADYDPLNLPAYAAGRRDVAVVPLLFAPYLKPQDSIPLEERPIDLLFIGSVNECRRAWLDRIEACGLSVAQFDGPLYGAERDAFIVQAKAVLNAPFYASSRFEQARVSHCLSLGTPVISERAPQYRPHAAFEDSVHWVADAGLERFFTTEFATPAFFAAGRAAVQAFEASDPIDAYAALLDLCRAVHANHGARRAAGPWQPRRINLGSGKDYKQAWLNLDIVERAQPDLVLDLGQPLDLPLAASGPRVGPLLLTEGSIEHIRANNVLEHVPDLATLMTNCLRLLEEGGSFQIEVPYEHAPAAWQDPTHVRAMNEQSWIYYTDWFWYLGWFEYRFEMAYFGYLDSAMKECGVEAAAFMQVLLRKTPTTLRERTTARTMQAELRLPEDEVAPGDRRN